MKRGLAVLLCLGLLLSGCTGSGASTATFADLTIEEYEMAKDSEGGLAASRQMLTDKPAILEKREQWRNRIGTSRLSMNRTPEEQGILTVYSRKVGDSTVSAKITSDLTVEIVKDGQVVYTYQDPRTARMSDHNKIVQGLEDWDGKWVLETFQEKVIVDGESLNDQLGYPEIFEFHMINGKPFYFFQQNDKVQIHYDGQVLPQEYDEVFHYGCCDSVDFNPQSSDRMISFFGRRGDQWYFVDIGNYE